MPRPKKAFWKSKTIQGILLSILPVVSGWLGYDLTQLADGASVNEIIQLAGAAWAWFGRTRAKADIAVSDG